MAKKVLCTLLAILALFSLAAGAGYGLAWYQGNHVTVGGHSYYIYETELDLTDRNMSIAEYEQLQAVLPECEITWMVPFQGNRYPTDTTSLTVSSFTREDMNLLLTYFPKLKSLDATACKDYALLRDFQTAMPDCAVSYQVELGGVSARLTDTALTLESGDYTLETLTENLQYLPGVTELTLKKPDMTLTEIEALRAAYPDIQVSYTVEILGGEYDSEITQLDLSAMTAADVEAVAQKLGMLPKLELVELMDADGNSVLTPAEVKNLLDMAPSTSFHYAFDFYGQRLSSDMEEVVLTKVKIGDAGEAELRTALDLMPKCKRFVLDTCGFSDEVLAKVRDDYRDRTKIVWRISFATVGSCLTDVDIFVSCGNLEKNYKQLQYCEDVVYMDIGHCEYLKTIEFVEKMPKLKALIVSGSSIADLSPLKNCKELEFLELGFCGYVEDLSPLKGLTNLRMLNIGNTKVEDLSPLDNINLSHLGARRNSVGTSRVPREEQLRFEKLHSACWATWEGEQPYGTGWRYEEDNLTFNPYYHVLRKVFRYDLAPNNPKQSGMYIRDIDGYLKDKLKENKTFDDYLKAAEDAWQQFLADSTATQSTAAAATAAATSATTPSEPAAETGSTEPTTKTEE